MECLSNLVLILLLVYPYISEWSEWSDCSHSCGQAGIKTRVKQCFNPPIDSDLPRCQFNDSKVESEPCPNMDCPSPTTGISLTEWTHWSSCHSSLDNNRHYQVRNRECLTRHCTDGTQEERGCINCPKYPTFLLDIDYPHNDITYHVTEDASICWNDCIQTEACKGFVWQKSTKNCFLKSKLDENLKKSLPGLVFGSVDSICLKPGKMDVNISP